MANTYELIASYNATSLVNNFSFTSIPQTYTDLLLRVSVQQNTGYGYPDNYAINFNADFLTTYISVLAYGYGPNVTNGGQTAQGEIVYVYMPDSTTTGMFTNTDYYIPNYTKTDRQKPIYAEGAAERNSNTNWIIHFNAQKYESNAAITSIRLGNYSNPTNFAINSSAFLYGIKNS